MNAKELISTIGATRKQLASWIERGLPFSGKANQRNFDPQEVSDWLLAEGIAQRPRIVETLADAAAAISVNRRTLCEWMKKGAPRLPNGNYDIDAIAAWRDARRQTEQKPVSIWHLRYLAERTKSARLDRKRQESQLVDRSSCRKMFQILTNHLRQAGERLGEKFGPAARKLIHEAIQDIEREADAVFPDKDKSPTTDSTRQ